jgi:hypothetical protein
MARRLILLNALRLDERASFEAWRAALRLRVWGKIRAKVGSLWPRLVSLAAQRRDAGFASVARENRQAFELRRRARRYATSHAPGGIKAPPNRPMEAGEIRVDCRCPSGHHWLPARSVRGPRREPSAGGRDGWVVKAELDAGGSCPSWRPGMVVVVTSADERPWRPVAARCP